jgi:amino acid transporter
MPTRKLACFCSAPLAGFCSAVDIAAAFTAIGLPWVTLIVSAAAAGIASVMLAFMLGCARIWFAMSRDGLLPAWFVQVHPRFRTPHRPTLIAGGLTALVASFFPIKEVAELVNIGTLSAFMIICLAIIVLRRTRRRGPHGPNPFGQDLAGAANLIAGAVKTCLVYDSLQHTLNLSRAKRLGNEGRAAQVRRQLFLRRARNKNKRDTLAFENLCNLKRLAVYHIDIQKSKVEGFM